MGLGSLPWRRLRPRPVVVTSAVSAAAGQGFRLLRGALAGDGPRQEDGISTELMM